MTRDSTAFDLLHPKLRKWIFEQGWEELRGVQEQAIPVILAADSDVILAAATASGKTEAAFMPLLSRLADDASGSVRVLYVSPLKALINDQFDRLEALCENLEIPVHRWHGDVSAAHKRRLLDRPAGVLIITPESLEALFVLRGPHVARLFACLDHLVIDELHAFVGTERGQQLQALMHRVELAVRRRVPRVGLSATLGDLSLACDFLRPGRGEAVRTLVSSEAGQELKLQLRGYRVRPPRISAKEAERRETTGETVSFEETTPGDVIEISQHLFNKLRGGHHLIFANARAQVEIFADRLRRYCELHRVPNEFWPHHGSLSKEVREETEAALKDKTRPATVVCTTTLELGIDVGAIESIAQIGVPPSVTSMRQRIGRSGRQGDAAILRIYVQEHEVTDKTPPHGALHPRLLEAVAMVELLIEKWYEPPLASMLHLSTLVQQVLSSIAQHGGIRADQAWRALCATGPFRAVDQRMFAAFLRSLAGQALITQNHDGVLVLDLAGERVVNHYSFFSAFQSPEEYRLTSGGKTLGSLPISSPVFAGLFLIFAGRRWIVRDVDVEHKVVDLEPAAGGRAPSFGGGSPVPIHDRVRRKMLEILTCSERPIYLDSTALDLFLEARQNFLRFDLHERSFCSWGDETIVLCWAGDRVINTLLVWLTSLGFPVAADGMALVFRGMRPEAVQGRLQALASAQPPSARELARSVSNLGTEKFHPFLAPELLAADYASRALDLGGATKALGRFAGPTSVWLEP